MSYRWAALALVLALVALMPGEAAGQQTSRGRGSGSMGASYPNPFNPEAKLPFEVGEMTGEGANRVCVNPNQQLRVTIRIYNVLAQPVAIPDFFGVDGSGPGTSNASGKVENLVLTCGRYIAFWDGKYMNTQREVSSGVYLWELIVDGKRVGVRRMFAAK